MEKYINKPVVRKEDHRFLTGRGVYTDDLEFTNLSYCYFLRSDRAHAKINKLDTSLAEKSKGVSLILTAKDIENVGGLPCGWQVIGKDDKAMIEPKHPLLAEGKVRHVGEPIAMIVADNLEDAKDAAEKITVDYTDLTVMTDMMHVFDKEPSPDPVHVEASNNQCFDWEIGNVEEIDLELKKSTHVVEVMLENNRLVANAIEPRSAIGSYSKGEDKYTLYTTSQNPHVIRMLMSAFVLLVPEHKVRVVSKDVGGGFGSKIYHYAEEALVCIASNRIGRSVKWTADRSESFISDAQGRDHSTRARLGLDENYMFTALKVETLANMGAYLSTFAPAIPTYLYATLLAGQYKTPKIYAHVIGCFTNTVCVDAYRGAGRPEATSVLERIVDKAARSLKIDPIELREKNQIKKDEFPYQTPVALEYDSGDFKQILDQAISLSDYKGFDKRLAESEKKGKLRGIGISSYIEACGIAPSAVAGALGARAGLYEVATIRVNPTGNIRLLTGAHSHGQGHETVFSQIVADKFGIDIDNIEVVHGDTDQIPFGMGTYGSRSLAVGGSAISQASDKIINKGKKIAAHLLEASDKDIDFEAGSFKVAGTDKKISFAEVALTAYVPHNYPIESLEPGLEETAFYDPKNFTFPSGSYICEVEVDEETGKVEILSFTAADDFGTVYNPMIVEGQVHGGLAQGLGQALLEHCIYDDEGQLLSASFSDYAMPRADDFPSFKVSSDKSTKCTHNPLGAKGCGEAGAIGSPAALVNAVLNAVNQKYDISHIDMPLTSYNVWKEIQNSKQKQNIT